VFGEVFNYLKAVFVTTLLFMVMIYKNFFFLF